MKRNKGQPLKVLMAEWGSFDQQSKPGTASGKGSSCGCVSSPLIVQKRGSALYEWVCGGFLESLTLARRVH